MKEILHFSHANGFPAGSYKTFFSYLSNDFEVGTIDRLGHDECYPVTNNWGYLLQQLEDYYEHHYDRPVYAVGHSLGGVLSMMLAAKRPDLIKGLIMLDSPLLTPFEARGVFLIKRLGLIDRVTPAGRTLGRQEEWDSLADVTQYFRQKKLFSAFDERCLDDYVQRGTKALSCGRRQLHFNAATEIEIYRTIPDNLHRTKPLLMPSAVIGGKYSDVLKKHHGRRMRNQLGMAVKWVEGGHMFPLEKPKLTADLIKDYISQWKNK